MKFYKPSIKFDKDNSRLKISSGTWIDYYNPYSFITMQVDDDGSVTFFIGFTSLSYTEGNVYFCRWN